MVICPQSKKKKKKCFLFSLCALWLWSFCNFNNFKINIFLCQDFLYSSNFKFSTQFFVFFKYCVNCFYFSQGFITLIKNIIFHPLLWQVGPPKIKNEIPENISNTCAYVVNLILHLDSKELLPMFASIGR